MTLFRKLRDSHVVIADLTGANPNVMYELGLRHTTGKLTVHLGEKGRLPFDVSTIRTIQFRRTSAGLVEARRSLVQVLASGLDGRFSPVMATRVWLENPGSELNAEPQDGIDSDSEPEELGSLEVLAEMESALPELSATLVAITNVVREIAAQVDEAAGQLGAASESDTSIATRVAIANRFAEGLEDPAARLEVLTAAFSESVRRSDPGVRMMIQHGLDQENADEAKESLASIKLAADHLLRGIASSREFRDSLVRTGSPTKLLGKNARRIAKALETMTTAEGPLGAWSRLSEMNPTG